MRNLRALAMAVVMAFPALAAYSQQTGEVTGTVIDAAGALVAGATVTATNTATQQVRAVTSNDTGTYTIPYLQPGLYDLKTEKSGFKIIDHPNVQVQIGEVARIDFRMEVGSVSQNVVVNTAEPLLTTESVSLGTVVGAQQITGLPLNGRDYLDLVALTPNVVAEAPSTGSSGLQGGVRSAEAIAIAGQRLEFNHYTLDGVENTDPNFNSYIIHPSIDAIQEFRVQTGVYSAEFGEGASQINATTKSGTNAYHFVAFEFLRNDVFDAKEWRQVGRKDPFRRNDYGFTLGGPLSIPKLFDAKDKLFFLSNFETLHDRLTTQLVGSSATAAMRSGDFSASGIPLIYDPLTRVVTGAGGSATQFPGNVIPQSRLSPQALAILNYSPPPTNPDNPLSSNYIRQASQPTDETQFNQRIDWVQNQKASWFGRFSWESDLSAPAALFQVASTAITNTTVRQAVIGNTYTISPSVVNEARFAWDQFNNDYAGYYANTVNVQATLGIEGLVASTPATYGVPAIGLGEGISSFGGITPWVTRDDLFQWTDSLSMIKGAHSIKVGGAIGRDRYNQNGNQKSEGEFDFDGASTDNPANAGKTGFVFADFMTGYVSQYYRVTSLANAELRRTNYAAFVQDDWKLSPRLTLNLGLRYENFRPWVDKHNSQINADIFTSGVTTTPAPRFTTPVSAIIPNSTSPILTRPGSGNFYQGMGFEYAQGQPIQRGNQYMGKALVNPNNWDFGPRIGINYSLGDKWSLRAGYGVFYALDIGNAVFDMSRNLGGKDGTVVATNARSVNLASPWAAEAGSPLCPGFNGPCISGPQINANFQNNRTGYIGQTIANVQRQLSQNVVVEVGYMGNQGHHLDRDFVFNQAVPKSGPSDTSSTTSRRPFPHFGPIQAASSFDNASYNALDVKVSQRLSHGLLYVVAYTWSKSIDGGSALRSNSGDTLWPTNSYNLAAERGLSQFDLPRRFVASTLYDLPFGRGRAFVTSGFLSQIVGGWQVGGILTLGDGTPVNASQLGDTAGLGTLGNQPDYTGASYIPAHRSAANYWNAAAFDYTSSDLNWMPGNMGRNTLFTPGREDIDTSLTRDIHIWESHSLNFRWEMFNAFNHPNWNVPSSSDARSPATFGVVTTASTMRQMQFALKYSF
ncbi:MAG: TonB-dependent receptor [Acidobacteriaceae bacterium]